MSSSTFKRQIRSTDSPAMDLIKEEDDFFPITVEEKSLCKSNGTTLSLIKYIQVDLLSHCIYCLRKTHKISDNSTPQQAITDDDPLTLLQAVPRAQMFSTSSPSLLSTFNQTWSYISTVWRERNERDVDDHLNLDDLSRDKGTVEFFELPRVCAFCAEKLKTIDTLFRDVKLQLDTLGSITQESKYSGKQSWRAKQFEQTLKSSTLDTAVIDDTIHILDNLGKGLSSTVLNENGVDSKFPTPKCSQQILENRPGGYSETADDTEEESDLDRVDKDDEMLSDDSVVYIKSEPEDEDEVEIKVGSPPPSIKPAIVTIQKSEPGRSAETESAFQYPIIPHVKKVPTQMCDLCKAQVPVTNISEHVRAHVGDEYLVPCPSSKCPNVYSSSKSLYTHLKDGNGKTICQKFIPNIQEVLEKAKVNVCQVCGRGFQAIKCLRVHLHRMHENPVKKFSCPIANCSQRFSVKQSAELHIPQHDLRCVFNKQICADCNGRYKVDEMEQHLKKSHQAEEIIKCNRCPFLFSTRNQLVEHLFVHRHGVLACDICGDTVRFSAHNQLRAHYFKVHQVGKQYMCEHCDRVYLTQFQWKEHVKKHDMLVLVPKPKGQYKCDACDAVFKADSTLRDHKIREHGSVPYSCRFCNETFPKHKLLRLHEKEHEVGPQEDKPEEVFACEEESCGKNFNSMEKLKHHVSTGHLGIRAHICHLCGKSYKTRSGLTNHRNSIHLGLRPHLCKTCGESFLSITGLRLHQRIHTLERPFTCDICGQSFRHKQVLKTHLEGHEKKGANFKPNGPMKKLRKRTKRKTTMEG